MDTIVELINGQFEVVYILHSDGHQVTYYITDRATGDFLEGTEPSLALAQMTVIEETATHC